MRVPGRKKIEEREAQYISVGTRVLDPEGGEWEVISFTTRRLIVKRINHPRTDSWWVEPTTLIRCRVPVEDR